MRLRQPARLHRLSQQPIILGKVDGVDLRRKAAPIPAGQAMRMVDELDQSLTLPAAPAHRLQQNVTHIGATLPVTAMP